MIDQLFEHGGIEFLLAQKMDQNSRIDIAAPRAHDHAAGWRQTHAGVDRFSGSDRGHACTIAEMGNHEAVRQIVCKLMHDRFTRKAVKSVTLNSFRLQFLRDRKDTCERRQFRMEGRVETRRLRKPRKMLLCEADDRQSRWNMQRREGGYHLELRQDR